MNNETMKGMQKKTIKKVLNSKIEQFLVSITDDHVRYLVRQDLIVTGGCIASFLLGEEVNDYDFYFRTKETTLAVAKYYAESIGGVFCKNLEDLHKSEFDGFPVIVHFEEVENIKGVMEERIKNYISSSGAYINRGSLSSDAEGELVSNDNDNYKLFIITDNAITLTDKVQLVTRFYGEPDKLHENFDFEHAKCYYDFATQELVTPPEALECMLSKTLKYNGSLYPFCSILRTRKFQKRGWTIGAGQILKMVMQLNEVDLTDINVLKEQLIGVDAAYFLMLITALRDSGRDIDSTYIMELVDELEE